METLGNKKELSDILLDKGIHIYGDMHKAVKEIHIKERFRIILSVLKRFNSILHRFYTKGVQKKRVELLDIIIDTEIEEVFLNYANILIEDTIKVMTLIKENVHSTSLNCPEKQDYIKKVMDKMNMHIGNFLVKHLYK